MAAGTGTGGPHEDGPGEAVARIVDFREDSPGDWFVIDDAVMGGRSAGAMNQAGDGVAAFEGLLSLDNDGGFTTARTDIPDGALMGASRMRIRVRGDGRRYQLRLHPGHRTGGVAFAADFEPPAGAWATVDLPLDAFEPTFRGRRPPDAGPMEPSRIGQVGLMINDGRAGPFRLEVAWIEAGR